jgi:hypothetical protein
MSSLTKKINKLRMAATRFRAAADAYNASAAEEPQSAAEPLSAAEPRSAAAPQCDGISKGLPSNKRIRHKTNMEGKTATEKKEEKKVHDEPRKSDAKLTADASASAAPAPSGEIAKKRRNPFSSASVAAPNVRDSLLAAPVAAVPAATVAAVPPSPIAAVPALAGAALAAVLAEVKVMRQSKDKTLRNDLGVFRITTAKWQTYITCQAPHNYRPVLLVTVTEHMSPFHRQIGWDLFAKLVTGEIDKVKAKELRIPLHVKYSLVA